MRPAPIDGSIAIPGPSNRSTAKPAAIHRFLLRVVICFQKIQDKPVDGKWIRGKTKASPKHPGDDAIPHSTVGNFSKSSVIQIAKAGNF